MNKDITEVVTKIVKALEEHEWAIADRLTIVLKELVKIEVAAIEGKRGDTNA